MIARLSFIAALIVHLLIMASAPTAAQNGSADPVLPPLPAYESLRPCNLNAYTEADNLIIGALVLNLQTGEGCAQNFNSTFHFASVGKLFIAGALYEKIAMGQLSFDTTLEFTADYLMGGRDDCLNEARLGEDVPLGELANLMIWCSDNAATWMIMDYLGWETVQAYIDRLGIEGIGTVIPYSEVDRIKLSLIDPRWENVPAQLAAQYYRSRFNQREIVAGALVPDFFDRLPDYHTGEIKRANSTYYEQYTYNTATPRAIADFLVKLWRDSQQPDSVDGQVAQWIFNTMLLTQRGYSSQEFPGYVYAGSKNGFDLGLRAEVNITVSDLENPARTPETISIIVVKTRDVTAPDVPFRFRNTPIEDLLKAVSPVITRTLYPDYDPTMPPIFLSSLNVRQITLHESSAMYTCWESYRSYEDLATCWGALTLQTLYPSDGWLGCGVVLNRLEGADARLTFVLTLPDGSHWSYQQQAFLQDSTGFLFVEQLTERGLWQMDVFLNLKPIFMQKFYVE